MALSAEQGGLRYCAGGGDGPMRGWALGEQKASAEAIAEHSSNGARRMATHPAAGPTWTLSWWLASMAERRSVGQDGGWLDAIAEALTAGGPRRASASTRRSSTALKGELLLQARCDRCAPEAETCFHRALEIARAAECQILGTARRDQPRPAVGRARQARPGPRPARAGLRLVHRGLGYRRSEGREGAARRAAVARRQRLRQTTVSS